MTPFIQILEVFEATFLHAIAFSIVAFYHVTFFDIMLFSTQTAAHIDLVCIYQKFPL